MGQLYGQFDPVSHEWSDGILAISYREFAVSTTLDRKWLMFDGPVDAIWIENMNTVLDDNKKLCLMSGEIIQLANTTNLIFEPMDLDVASPATVSRCGMIYMEPLSLGWEPLFISWRNILPPSLHQVNKQLITSLFMRFCPVLLWFVRQLHVKEMMTTSNSNLVVSCMNLFDCFMDDYYDEKYMANLTDLDVRSQLEGIFFFSCIWSLGAALESKSRIEFSDLFRALLEKSFTDAHREKFQVPKYIEIPPTGRPYIVNLPRGGTVFDYRFIKQGKGIWKPWSVDVASAPPIPRDIPANQIIILTVENIRIYTILDLLVRHGKPTLFVGPTGTGKSVYTIEYLLQRTDTSVYTPLMVNFSAQTSANQTQDIIMVRLDRRRKGVLGPPVGKKCVIFVDDVSMPLKVIVVLNFKFVIIREFCKY